MKKETVTEEQRDKKKCVRGTYVHSAASDWPLKSFIMCHILCLCSPCFCMVFVCSLPVACLLITPLVSTAHSCLSIYCYKNSFTISSLYMTHSVARTVKLYMHARWIALDYFMECYIYHGRTWHVLILAHSVARVETFQVTESNVLYIHFNVSLVLQWFCTF